MILYQDERYTITTLPPEITRAVAENPPVKPVAGKRAKLIQAGESESDSGNARKEWGF